MRLTLKKEATKLAARTSSSNKRASTRLHDTTITVTHCGRICLRSRSVDLSHAFDGQNVRVTQVGERDWLVTLMHQDLGDFDDATTCRLEPIDNPFTPKVMS